MIQNSPQFFQTMRARDPVPGFIQLKTLQHDVAVVLITSEIPMLAFIHIQSL